MTDKKLTQLSSGSAIVDADLFYSAPQAGGQVKQPASALRTYLLGGSGIRTLLTADLDLYIDPAGNDTTGTGLTIGSPWQTIQKAFNYVMAGIDLAGAWTVNINMASGTYAGGFLGGPTPSNGAFAINLINNGTVTISDASTGLYIFYGFLSLSGSGTYTFTMSASGAQAIFVDQNGLCYILAPLQFTANATNTDHLYVQQGGSMFIGAAGTTSITGNFNSHMRAANGGTIIRTGNTTTFNSSPTVGTAFAIAEYNGSIKFNATQTFTGTLTGKKFSADMCGTIEAFGATLPGTVAGTETDGGNQR